MEISSFGSFRTGAALDPGFWIPGMLLAAIPFPEGIHSGHADLYFVFAMAIDFFLYAGVAYWLLNIFFPRNVKAEQMLS